MVKYPAGALQADAQYTPALRALYQGNPWIEALPDSLFDADLFHALHKKIPYHANERTLDCHTRKECIQALPHVFIPMGKTGEIARKIDAAIREGYVGRNPLDSCWNRQMGQLQSCIHHRDSSFISIPGYNARASGFCLVGDSGMGKTSTINHTLALYPQVLFHQAYHNMPFHNVQLVWMRLECPMDASVKGICSEFFMELDRITGDNTFAKFASGGRATTDQMIPQMAMIAQRHGLGLLVIDEIQNLSSAKSGGAQRMLNFLVQLINKIGLPLLLVGTPPAMQMLSANLMTARRTSGQQGLTVLSPLENDTFDWDTFTKGIWRYQWTAEITPITLQLQNELHAQSYGNIDAAVKLFMEAQRLAIQNGQHGEKEVITPQLIREAAASSEFRFISQRLKTESSLRAKMSVQQANISAAPGSASAPPNTPLTAAAKNRPSPVGIQEIKTGEALLDSLMQDGQLVRPEDEF